MKTRNRAEDRIPSGRTFRRGLKRRIPAAIAVIVVWSMTILSMGFAELPNVNLSMLPLSTLQGLQDDISTEIRQHHTMISRIEEAILQAVKTATEAYYADQGITVSWAWFGWEYQYAREKDFFTFHSHLDYTDSENRGHRVNVDAELYLQGTEYLVHRLYLDGSLVVSDDVELPESLIVDPSHMIINEKTGINLSLLSEEELGELERRIEEEIQLNHTTGNSALVNDVLKKTVEQFFSGRGVTVEWPWRDYSYTGDWDCYTETTSISYEMNGEKYQNVPVYAEIFPLDGAYRVCFLTIGDETVIDDRAQITGGNALLFLQSRAYEEGSGLFAEENYEAAYERFLAAGNYDDSVRMAERSLEQINLQKYNRAQFLYDRGDYTEALEIFDALKDYADSMERAAQCQEALKEIQYQSARNLMISGKYEEAIEAFEAIPEYRDSEQQIEACRQNMLADRYGEALSLMRKRQYEKAIEAFTAIEGYQDSREKAEECRIAILDRKYSRAKAEMVIGRYDEAIALFESLDGYEDSKAYIELCREKRNQAEYNRAEQLFAKGLFAEAEQAFSDLGTYSDSAERALQVGEILFSLNREIVFPETEYYLFQGDKIRLEPEIRKLREEAADSTTLNYQSDNPQAVRVGKDGTVNAVKCGDAILLCEAADNPYIKTEITVHVVKSVNRILLDTNRIDLSVPEQNGNSIGKITVTTDPADAFVQTGVWSSSQEEVARVDSEGRIRAVGIGKAVITFTSDDTSKGKKTATCTVNVTQAVTALSLPETSGTIHVGKAVRLTPTIEPQNAGNKKLIWTSEDEKIATVNANGEIRGRQSGTTIITVASPDGPSAQYEAVVRIGPTALRVSVTAKCVARNRVGSKWEQTYYLEGKAIKGSGKVTVAEGDTFEIGCTIRENDRKPEEGGFTETVEATPELLTKGTRIEKTVLVTENEGKYSGNTAEWKVVFTIKP